MVVVMVAQLQVVVMKLLMLPPPPLPPPKVVLNVAAPPMSDRHRQVHRRLLVWTERAQTRGMMIDVRVRVRPLALQRIRTRYARVTWNTCTVQNAFVVQNTNTRHGYSTVLFAAARPPLKPYFRTAHIVSFHISGAGRHGWERSKGRQCSTPLATTELGYLA